MVNTISRGVNAVGRTTRFRKSGRWQHVTKTNKSTKTTTTTTPSKWYNADDTSVPLKSRKKIV